MHWIAQLFRRERGAETKLYRAYCELSVTTHSSERASEAVCWVSPRAASLREEELHAFWEKPFEEVLATDRVNVPDTKPDEDLAGFRRYQARIERAGERREAELLAQFRRRIENLPEQDVCDVLEEEEAQWLTYKHRSDRQRVQWKEFSDAQRKRINDARALEWARRDRAFASAEDPDSRPK